MRIAVISDTHLGYKFGTEQGEDAFMQASEAIDTAIAKDADLIILPGDIFDMRVPKPEILAQSFELLHKTLTAKTKNVRVIEMVGKDGEVSPIAMQGVPVVAIHGTHERRGLHSVNPIHVLEKAGFLVHLDCNGVVFDIDGEKLCIQGLSGVPEQDVKKTLAKWNPRPVPGCSNVFLFHQSMKEYIYSDEQETFLSVADLPAGFDLYIDGHIHWSHVLDDTARGKKILLPGSTVITQQKKKESEKKKGFFMIDIGKDGVQHEFVELEKQRPFHYKELVFENAGVMDIVSKCRDCVNEVTKTTNGKKPLVRLKLKGTLEKGKTGSDICDDDICRGYDAIISISKELESDDMKKRVKELRELQQQKMSVDEMGVQLINDLLKETGYKGLPPEEILDMLADGKNDDVVKKVMDNFGKTSSNA